MPMPMQMLTSLRTRIEEHPEELLPMFEELTDSYNRAKSLQRADPKMALHMLDTVMHKVHCLQRLPAAAVPLSYEMWSTHLARIYNCCHHERDSIHRTHTKWAALESANNPGSEQQAVANTDPATAGHSQQAAPAVGLSFTPADRVLQPWIRDWTDDTLQSNAVLQLVKRLVVPILYPNALHTVHGSITTLSPTLLVEGRPNTGKSHAMAAVRKYLHQHQQQVPHLDVHWVSLTAYDFPQYAQQVLQKTQSPSANPNEWTVYVTDRVSHRDMQDWCGSSWCGAWDRHLRQQQNVLWVVLVTSARKLDPSHYKGLFPHRIYFDLPDSRTAYHYMKSCMYRHFGHNMRRDTPRALVSSDEQTGGGDAGVTTGHTEAPEADVPTRAAGSNATTNTNTSITNTNTKRTFPSFARLPVVDNLPEFAHFMDTYVHAHRPDFGSLGALFEEAVRWSSECGLRENGVYGVHAEPEPLHTATPPPHLNWYPKHSVHLSKLPDTYEYKLLHPFKHDFIEWCPQTEGGDHAKCGTKITKFMNVHLHDTLTSCEYDRFTQLYIDPESIHMASSGNKYSVIGVLPVEVDIFPFHLQQDWMCSSYEWAAAFGYAVANATHATHAPNHTPSENNSPNRRLYPKCSTTADIQQLNEHQCSELFGRVRTDPAGPTTAGFSKVTASSQVWYMERKRVAPKSVVPRVHISYNGRTSAELTDYAHGVDGNVSAGVLQQIISVLVDSPDGLSGPSVCHVVQVQTHSGYAYYVDFAVPLGHAFELQCVSENCESHVCPCVQLPTLAAGWHLGKDYAMCTESDVDALAEAFPQDYRDVYADDEATWKLKPVRKPVHIDHLNSKYSSEQKCYLKLFCDMLRLKESYYACLPPELRNQLDDALVDLQSHLDYLLQIIPENDHTGKWNEVWTMSDEHPLHEMYHPPKHSEVDKIITVNLATEWLRKGATFRVSPRWLNVFAAVGHVAEVVDRRSAPAPTTLAPMVRTWRVFCGGDVHRATRWVYVKSYVEPSMWQSAKACTKLQESAAAEMAAEPALRGNPTVTTAAVGLYKSRAAKDSLFHAMFRNAEYIGTHQPSTNTVHWMRFQHITPTRPAADPVLPCLLELSKEPMLWPLLTANTPAAQHPWLFALRHTDPESPTGFQYNELYAHMLFPKTMAYWSAASYGQDDCSLLQDMQHNTAYDHFVRQYAYIHKQMHHRPLELHGALPGKFVRHALHEVHTVSSAPQLSANTKRVIQTPELATLSCFGLDVHHFADVVTAMHTKSILAKNLPNSSKAAKNNKYADVQTSIPSSPSPSSSVSEANAGASQSRTSDEP